MDSQHANPMVQAADAVEADGGSWWSRRCGGREVLVVALPLMISTLSYSLMQFCDRVFLTWYSPTSVAATLPAGVMAWILLSFPLGVAMYTGVFVAQYYGAGQHHRIGQVIRHGLILGCLFVPLFAVSMCWPHAVFRWAGHAPALVEHEAEYLRYITPGSVAQVLAAVLAGFFIGRGKTWVVMLVDVMAAALNVLLDWLMIFGFDWSAFFGGAEIALPAMGIRGAAMATSIAVWFKLAVTAVLLCRPTNVRLYQLRFAGRFEPELLVRMVRFGSSNGLQILIECLGIAVFSLMIGRLGEVPSAASGLALSVNMLVFVPVWGLSTAVSTLVGQQIGGSRPDLAARATWTALRIGLVYTSVFAVMYLLAPHWFLFGYDAAGSQVREITALVKQLLFFVALYCLFDTVQIVFVGAIKGAGDTLFVVVTSLVGSCLFVTAGLAGYWLTEREFQTYWWWGALTGWVLWLAVVFSTRFLGGKWKSMRVIEPVVIKPAESDRPGQPDASEPDLSPATLRVSTGDVAHAHRSGVSLKVKS
jgi:MATE family multidrug resistance protein